MKIYEARQAPNPRRARIFMSEKHIDLTDIEFVQIDLGAGENLQADFREKNPMGGVPVLELDDGTVITESMAICRYFEMLYPEPPLMGRDALDQARIEQWNRRMELNFMLPVAFGFRHITGHFKDRENVFPDYGKDCLATATRMFDFLDQHLATSEFIAGDTFTVADITALVSIDFGRVVKLRIGDQQTHLKRWHDAVSARPSASA